MAKSKVNTASRESIDLVDVLSGTDGYIAKEAKSEKEKEKKNPFVELLDAVFKGNVYYINNITEQQAKQNIFMILRRVGIGYPCIANAFNKPNTNALDTIKFISSMMSKQPFQKWVYTSTSQNNIKTSSKREVTKSDVEDYKEFYGICTRDFDSAMRLFPEETIDDIIEYKNFIKKTNSFKDGKEDVDN